MNSPRKIVVATATLAFALTPAAALAQGAAGTHGKSQTAPGHTKSGAPAGSKAKAFGKACQAESKKHVADTPGTPFSACVKAMAQLHKGTKTNPHMACATESKKHVAGQKGTPYSECVRAAAKLRRSSGASSTS